MGLQVSRGFRAQATTESHFRADAPSVGADFPLDWADPKNFWRLLPAGSERPEEGELENTPEAVEAWAASLQQRFIGRPVAVCLVHDLAACVFGRTPAGFGCGHEWFQAIPFRITEICTVGLPV
jgi:hypothetical protein